MKNAWLNFVLHFSGVIAGQKMKLARSAGMSTIFYSVGILFLELLNFILSLPAYFLISPQSIGIGVADKSAVASYRLRRTISLTVLLSTGLVWAIWFFLTAVIGLSVGSRQAYAGSVSWDFNTPANYLYDPLKIQIVDGMAVLKAQTVSTVPTTPSIDTTLPTTEETPTDTATPSVIPATEAAPIPTVSEPAPAPVTQPTPTPTPTPVPAPSPSGGLLNMRDMFIAPVHAQGTICEATLQPIVTLPTLDLKQWTSFNDVMNADGGNVTYQLSDDTGLTWHFIHNGDWTEAGENDFSAAEDINNHIADFPGTAGSVLFKAHFVSDCSHDIELLGVTIAYEHQEAVTENATVTLDPAPVETVVNDISSPVVSTTTEELLPPSTEELVSDLSGTTVSEHVSPGITTGGDTVVSISPNVELELTIPKTSNNKTIRVCPGLTDPLEALLGCLNDVLLTAAVPEVAGYSLVRLDDPNYWHIRIRVGGTTVAVAVEVATPSVAQPQSCGTLARGNLLDTASSLLNVSVADYSITSDIAFSTQESGGLRFRAVDLNNFWGLAFENGLVHFKGLLNGVTVFPEQHTTVSFTPRVNTAYQVKVQVQGSDLRAKWWVKGHVEPDVWFLYGHDERLLTGGVGVLLGGVSYNNLLVSSCLTTDTLSDAQINNLYLAAQNHAPSVSHISASQDQDDGFVDVSYMLSDPEGDFSSLVSYDYSLTGAFAGEERPMTEANDTDHNGTYSLEAPTNGSPHAFIWDVAQDIRGIYDGTVYVRLRASDSLERGIAVVSSPFVVDLAAPDINNLTVVQEDGANLVRIQYHITDDTEITATVSLLISYDGGITWSHVTSLSGDTGTVSLGTADKTITWDAGRDWSGNDINNLRIQLTAIDIFGNHSVPVESDASAVDTYGPFGAAAFVGQASDTNSILWSWSPVAHESHFDRYEIWYGTSEASVNARGDGAPQWNISNDSDLGIMGTRQALITGLASDTRYYAKLWAYDRFGNSTLVNGAWYATQPEPITSENNEDSVISAPTVPTTSSSVPFIGGNEETNPIEDIVDLPPEATVPPVAPTGGFRVRINDNDAMTSIPAVDLSFTAGLDAVTMAISNYEDLHDAIQEPFVLTKKWNLCSPPTASQGGVCEPGTHTVYVKFYTVWGQSSDILSDRIRLTELPLEDGVTLHEILAPTNIETRDSSGSVSRPLGGGGPLGSLGSNGAGNTTRQQASGGGSNAGNVSGNGEGIPSPVISFKGVSPAQRRDVLSQQAGTPFPLLQELTRSRESRIVPVPRVASVNQATVANKIVFSGKSIPNTDVILFIHSDQVAVYTTHTDDKGAWQYEHSQDEITLAPGEHTVFAVTYDHGSRVRSQPSEVKTFMVKMNPWGVLLSYLDLSTTILTILFVLAVAAYLLRNRFAGHEQAT